MGYLAVRLGKKIKTSVALDIDLIKWIDSQIAVKKFASRSHAVEYALEELRKTKH